MQQLLRILDSRLLSRISNFKELLTLVGAAVLVATGLILAAIALATNVGAVPLLFMGLGLVVVLSIGARRVAVAWKRGRDAFAPDAPADAVALRYSNGTRAIFSSVSEALAQAGHDVATGQADPQGVYSRDGETLAGRLEIERAANSASTSAKDAVHAEPRPLLLNVPYENYTDFEHEYPWAGGIRKTPMRGQIVVDVTYGAFVFPVRNIGHGPAVIESFSLTLNEVDETYSENSGIVVPVGEDAWLAGTPDTTSTFSTAFRRQPAPVHGAMPYTFTVTYTDVAGKQRQRLELGVGTKGRDSALRVLRTEHVDPSDNRQRE